MKILRIFGVLVLCLFAVYDGAIGAYFNRYALNSNSGNLNPSYVNILCAYVNNNVAKWYKHRANESNQTCPTDSSVYTINNQDLSLSGLDIPQKEACDANNENCEPERFVSYNPSWSSLRMPATSDTQTSWTIYNRTYPGNTTSYFTMSAQWTPISGKTKVNLTYVPGEGSYWTDPNDGATSDVLKTCVYDDASSDGCQILPADTFVAPAGKYFDGWFCDSNAISDSNNCKIPRYLPNNYAGLSPAITPVLNSLSNLSRYSDYINGEIPQTMATAYTGSNNLTMTASWAPHNITFSCNTSSDRPFAPINAQNRSITINQYTTNTGETKDIVFGSTIKLNKNLDRLPKCKSPYNKYDEDRGNDKWCEKFLTNPVNSGFSLPSHYTEIADIENLDNSSSGSIQLLFGHDGVSVPINQGCAIPRIHYSCGNFPEAPASFVDGVPPEKHWNEYYNSNTQQYDITVLYYHTNHYVDDRNRPLPAKPYPDGGVLCNQTQLSHTGFEFYQVTTGSNTTPGNGCCIPTEYGNSGNADTGQRKHAVFKGWQATSTRDGVPSVLTNNGWQSQASSPEPRLLQPNEYGYGSVPDVNPSCNLTITGNTFADETAIDNWNPGVGCNLWPWATDVTFKAVWDYAPILVTLDGNSILPNIYLDYNVGFFTEDTFENQITNLTQEQTGIPAHAIFGGYYWCPGNGTTCESPEQIINANGEFVSGTQTFTKVDAIIWPMWECEPNYHEDNGACIENKITLVYNNGGHGGNAPESYECTHDEEFNLAAAMQATGFTFGGWQIENTESALAGGASVVCDDDTFGIQYGTVNLTAQWDCEPGYHEVNGVCVPEEYSVNYLCNNNTDASKSDTATFNQNYTIKSVEWSECTKDHATFVDWVFAVNNEHYTGDGTASFEPWQWTTGDFNFIAQWICNTGYQDVNGVCAPIVQTITLNSSGANNHGTTEIYTQYDTGVFLNYTDSIVSNQMTVEDNPITIPQDTGTLTYDLNGGVWTSESPQQRCVNNGGSWTAESSQCTADRTFNGYHTSHHAPVSDLYIKSDGHITQGGITVGVQALGPMLWYANWTDPAFNLDNHVAKENMVFSGWLESGQTQPLCAISNIWTSLLDPTEVAQWQECDWTPGEHSSLNFETVTDNQCVYTVVCDNGYSQNGGNDDTTQFTFTGTQYNSNGRQDDGCFSNVTQPPACQLRSLVAYYNCGIAGGTHDPESESVPYETTYTVQNLNGCDTSIYEFNGWKTDWDDSVFYTGDQTLNWDRVQNQTFTAQWCRKCEPGEHATCELDATIPGTCTYTTTCTEGYIISGNGTYNPTCTAVQYSVTYTANGGNGEDVIQNVDYQGEFTTYGFSQTNFTRDGYILVGWQHNVYSLIDNHYDSYDVLGDTTLPANWGQCVCSLGTGVASCVPSSTTENTCTGTATCLPGYQNPQVNCVGVNCTSECTDCDAYHHLDPDSGTCVLNVITINYLNGGHGTAPEPDTCEYGSGVTLPPAITTTDSFTFNSWGTNGHSFNASADITCDFATLGVYGGDVDVLAQWCDVGYSPNATHDACMPNEYTVNYICNNNTTAPKSDTATFNQNYTIKSVGWSECTKDNATFVDWVFSINNVHYTGDGTASFEPWQWTTGDFNFTAQWVCNTGYHEVNGVCVPNEYTVNYLCNNNTNASKSDTATFNQNYNIKSIGWSECTKDNATFVDWVFSINNVHYTGDGTASFEPWQWTTGDFNFTAQWACNTGYHEVNGVCTQNKITLIYNNAGHGITPGSYQCTYGQQFNLAPALQEQYFVFNGWKIESTNMTLAGGAPVVCNADTFGIQYGTVNLTAQWECPEEYQSYGNSCIPCGENQHVMNDQCYDNEILCIAPHATRAIRTWSNNVNAYSSCQIEKCEDAYHIESNACVPNVKSCTMPDGRGEQHWNGREWGNCEPIECDPGYELDITGRCVDCGNKIVSFNNQQDVAVSSYATGCQIAACMYQGEKYKLENNTCKPICEDNEDYTGQQHWDDQIHRCKRTCNRGYLMW